MGLKLYGSQARGLGLGVRAGVECPRHDLEHVAPARRPQSFRAYLECIPSSCEATGLGRCMVLLTLALTLTLAPAPPPELGVTRWVHSLQLIWYLPRQDRFPSPKYTICILNL